MLITGHSLSKPHHHRIQSVIIIVLSQQLNGQKICGDCVPALKHTAFWLRRHWDIQKERAEEADHKHVFKPEKVKMQILTKHMKTKHPDSSTKEVFCVCGKMVKLKNIYYKHYQSGDCIIQFN